MKRLFIATFLAGAALAAFSSPASAYTLSTSAFVLPGSSGLELGLITDSAWTRNNASVVKLANQNISGQHVLTYDSPGNPTNIKGAYSYLAVLAGGVATYSLSQPKTTLSFDWGTIDSYNYVDIFTSGNTTGTASYTISGSDLMASPDGYTGLHVSLFDAAGIAKIVFRSVGQNALEIKNLIATPIPAALGLFGSSLLGFAAAARRRKSV